MSDFLDNEYDQPNKCPPEYAGRPRWIEILNPDYEHQRGLINFSSVRTGLLPYNCHGLPAKRSTTSGDTYPLAFPTERHWAYRRPPFDYHEKAVVNRVWANDLETVPHLLYFKQLTDDDIVPLATEMSFRGWGGYSAPCADGFNDKHISCFDKEINLELKPY